MIADSTASWTYTSATVRAAIEVVRAQQPSAIVLAVALWLYVHAVHV